MRAGHETPRVTIHFETRLAARAGRSQRDGRTLAEGVDGYHVPRVLGYNVGDQKVHFFDAVFSVFGVAGADAVIVRTSHISRFDLHTPRARASLNDKVIGVAVSPRPGDGETKQSCLVKERRFGDLTTALDGKVCALSGSRLVGCCNFG